MKSTEPDQQLIQSHHNQKRVIETAEDNTQSAWGLDVWSEKMDKGLSKQDN